MAGGLLENQRTEALKTDFLTGIFNSRTCLSVSTFVSILLIFRRPFYGPLNGDEILFMPLGLYLKEYFWLIRLVGTENLVIRKLTLNLIQLFFSPTNLGQARKGEKL